MAFQETISEFELKNYLEQNYIVVTGREPSALSARVCEMLTHKYAPVGGVCACKIDGGTLVLYQAMLKQDQS
jgi:hypothetical protein